MAGCSFRLALRAYSFESVFVISFHARKVISSFAKSPSKHAISTILNVVSLFKKSRDQT